MLYVLFAFPTETETALITREYTLRVLTSVAIWRPRGRPRGHASRGSCASSARASRRPGTAALEMGVCCFARPTTKHSIQLRGPQSRSSLSPNRPRAARIRRPSSTARCSWQISTPRASSWVVTTLLTERSSRDLSTQLAFERDTRSTALGRDFRPPPPRRRAGTHCILYRRSPSPCTRR